MVNKQHCPTGAYSKLNKKTRSGKILAIYCWTDLHLLVVYLTHSFYSLSDIPAIDSTHQISLPGHCSAKKKSTFLVDWNVNFSRKITISGTILLCIDIGLLSEKCYIFDISPRFQPKNNNFWYKPALHRFRPPPKKCFIFDISPEF